MISIQSNELQCFYMSTKTHGSFWFKRTGRCGFTMTHAPALVGSAGWRCWGPAECLCSPHFCPGPFQGSLHGKARAQWGSLYPTLLSGINPTFLLWPQRGPHDLVLASSSISPHPEGSEDHTFPESEGGCFLFLGQRSQVTSFLFLWIQHLQAGCSLACNVLP